MNGVNNLDPIQGSDFPSEDTTGKPLPEKVQRIHLASKGRIHDFSKERRIPTNHIGEPIPSVPVYRSRSSSDGARISPKKTEVEEKK